jgi:hypothetical protein
VQTAEYLWSRQKTAADPKMYAPYLTWAYPLYRYFGDARRAGIKTVLYVNPLMPVPDNRSEFPLITGSYRNLQAADCGGSPVRSYGGNGYLLDVRKPQAREAVREVVDAYVKKVRDDDPDVSEPIDLVFVDNANSFYGVRPMPCGYNASDWTNAMDAALAGSRFPLVINTLSVTPARLPEKVAALRGNNIVGLMYEHCFTDRQWIAEETAQILTIRSLKALHKPPGAGFWCYVNGREGAGDAATLTQQRLFQYASFLLTYDPAYSVYESAYRTMPSTFKVFPETQFVPLGPEIAASSIEDLRDGGVYEQRYSYCYYRGKFIAACEIAVNPNLGTASVPDASDYRRSAVLNGAGVLDGGTMTFNGPPVDTLGPYSAAILLP